MNGYKLTCVLIGEFCKRQLCHFHQILGLDVKGKSGVTDQKSIISEWIEVGSQAVK